MKLKKLKLPKIQPKILAIAFRLSLECFFLALLLCSLIGILSSNTSFELSKFTISAVMVSLTAYATKKL